MTTKKIVLLSVFVILLIVLGFWAKDLSDNANRSDTELISFNIEDTAAVDKIIITEPNTMSFTVVRGENGWTDKDGNCVIQENVNNIMEVIKNIEFKGYVTENSKQNHLTMMSAQGIKVEIHKDGEWHKTWYVGTATPDHYAQVMLLESAEDGKSDLPVLMTLKGFNGILDPRFFADARKWQCTNIMAFDINDVQKVEVKNNYDKGRSFTIDRDGFKFEVRQAGNKLESLDTTQVFRYFSRLKKVNFELPNYVLSPFQVDSIKKTEPFVEYTVTDRGGVETYLKCFRLAGPEGFDNEFGEVVNHDLNRFWCLLPNGNIVKCQYFVFDPLFRGDLYFPFDKTIYEKSAANPAQ